MLRIVPFEASHLVGVILHPKQARYQYLLDRGPLPGACTAFDGGGVVAIGGVVESLGEMTGWLLFTNRFKPRHMLAVFRACRAGMKAERIVFDIDPDDAASARLGRLFGARARGVIQSDGQRSLTRMVAHGA